MKVWKLRTIGILTLLSATWYLGWLLTVLNYHNFYISIPFAIGCILLGINILCSVINNWKLVNPIEIYAGMGRETNVAIIIPTLGEPIEMIARTVQSVLDQNWPKEKIVIIISDDSHRVDLKKKVEKLQLDTQASIIYNEPPLKNSILRKGEGKAGNLNSALDFVRQKYPRIKFIETRDADDLVGDKNFLRYCVGILTNDASVDFVQTIKEGIVSEGDPFGNQEPIFYRRTMLSKYAVNAAYPCGSGLVWSKEALEKIEGFSHWNLVEDLHTGYKIFQKGGKGVYLPIVGALGQISPEDIPNFYKQRGTWAVDSLRIFFWQNPLFAKGLSLEQKIQFLEVGTFYLLGPVMLVFIATILISLLFNIYPTTVDQMSYALHFWPYFALMELFLVVKGEGLTFESLWRSRQTWMGLAPVFTKAAILALIYGPNKKPSYKVTRKIHLHKWYWKQTLPQTLILIALTLSIFIQVMSKHNLTKIDFGSIFWACFFGVALLQTIQNGWFGLSLKKRFLTNLSNVANIEINSKISYSLFSNGRANKFSN